MPLALSSMMTARILDLTAARSYLLPLFNDGHSTLADIASTAKARGDTQQTIAEAMGYALTDVQAMFSAAGIPGFAVGTNYVPRDMLAQIHKGEAIVPAAYNPAAGGSGNADLVAELRAVRAEVAALRAELAAERASSATISPPALNSAEASER
jgi:hypothetical protein